MRFFADMGVGTRATEWLRLQGHEVTHLREEGLQRLSDHDVFAKALAENRVLMTFDLDFGEIAALCAGHRTGIMLFRLRNTCAAHVIERLSAALAACAGALETGCVVVVEESRLRVREFPQRAERPRDAR